MEVRLADHFGMCFGVRDAIDLALRLTQQGPLTILGDLVHNPDVVAQLDAAGAVRAHHPEEVHTPAVLLTAHGTAQEVKQRLRHGGHQVHDAVCPLVKRVHQAVFKLVAEGRHPVVIGQPGHVEVRGLIGDLAEYTIIMGEPDLEQVVLEAALDRVRVAAPVRAAGDRVLGVRVAVPARQVLPVRVRHRDLDEVQRRPAARLDRPDERLPLQLAVCPPLLRRRRAQDRRSARARRPTNARA